MEGHLAFYIISFKFVFYGTTFLKLHSLVRTCQWTVTGHGGPPNQANKSFENKPDIKEQKGTFKPDLTRGCNLMRTEHL